MGVSEVLYYTNGTKWRKTSHMQFACPLILLLLLLLLLFQKQYCPVCSRMLNLD